jgi:uncharacterized protein (DUF2126 family)/transglutaminase-like putative cysteine protease
MAIHAALTHVTHYKYARPARLSPQVIRLRPAPHSKTSLLSYSLTVTPEDHFINWQQDPYNNYLARVVFPEPIHEFKVEVGLVAELSVFNPFDFFVEPSYEVFATRKLEGDLAKQLEIYLEPFDYTRPFREYRESLKTNFDRTIEFLVHVNTRLQQDIGYTVRMEPGIQTPRQTLTKRTGSCRDSAWLLINLLRSFGFASRFVSGYLIQLKPDEKSIDGPSGTEVDFTDLHAWTEVYLPGAGWIGLDPTSGLLAGEGHIPLACAPDPQFASPITGALEDVKTEFHFDMKVERVSEVPRISLPYSDASWHRLYNTGSKIDERIIKNDIRLTMGGEPTFISIDDMDGPEWNTEAVGPKKFELSAKLLRKLWLRFGKGGFLHHGQGKWYPGESLPRWAFSCFWRRDGQPLWRNPKLLANIEHDYEHTIDDAKRFAHTLGKTLRVRVDTLLPAYEDTFYYLWKEQRLPVNVDPSDSKLKDPEERARLKAVFEEDPSVPKGWVLPLQKLWQAKQIWASTPWDLRGKKLLLSPGDSPLGLRLPLDSLPWVRDNDYPYVVHSDPFAPSRDELQSYSPLFQQFKTRAIEAVKTLDVDKDQRQDEELPETPKGESRTALCVEPRDGKLFVFIPPVSTLDDYLELLSAIEATAEALDLPIILEGEKPPFDHRVQHLSVTPDPGVIEVNIHPAASWAELAQTTTSIYEDARECRLGTSKFMLDGRHTGTGGGNHIVLGGASPEDSPFLRRPDLLRSLIAYWHHHPSLSYLFSSMFIGPTSQSPRIDEARDDSLYEMEIAFKEVEKTMGSCPPWMTDRIFRNLLIDITGNTHRAEFCIDKLYNPDAANGRLGLLELRSFEMPPNARMSLAQNLLLRALVVKFWENPYYPRRLARWGTDLHDRMMLPHYIWEDFSEVLADIETAGFAFELEWFQSHLEFRYPFFGKLCYKDIEVEIRQAMEPWHVMGEEGMAGGTVRFVDSSVERVQAKVEGFSERYILTCNRRRVPLRSTGRKGAYVAGVRYRAWQPPSALHPTLPVDAPLIFDLVDTWTMRAVAGCRYHVAHPAGRNYEVFPVNAYEAESRRLSRFETMGFTTEPYDSLPEIEQSIDFPSTLDLRNRI